MHYLIDGHNLIGQMPDIELADPDDEQKLVQRIRRWTLADPRRRVTLFFDGGLFHGKSAQLSGSLVTVIFSSRKQTADTLIKRALEELRNPQEHTLVTSDRAIVSVARRQRVSYIRSERFAVELIRDLLQREAPEPEPAPPPPKEEPNLSEGEVAEWLSTFGPEPARQVRPYRRRKKATPEPAAVEPPPSPRTADELKDSGEQLTDEELAQWLTLFGQAAPEKAADTGRSNARRKSDNRSLRRKTDASPRPADQLKATGARLSREEVDEWLDLFGDDADT